MRRLADSIGISAMTAYRYYADKEALLLDLKSIVGERLTQSVAEAIAPTVTPLDQLRAAGFAYLNFALDHEQDYRLLFDAYIVGSEAVGDKPADAKTAWDLLLHILDACLPDCPAERREALAKLIWATVHGLAMLHLSNRMPLARPVQIHAAPQIDELVQMVQRASQHG